MKGHQALTLCQFHLDKNPSLSIDTERGLFNCLGCGVSGDIFRFFKLKHNLNGDFRPLLKGIARDFGILEPEKPGRRNKQRGRVVATYDYTNAAGELLFQVVKDEFKNFWQRRPEAAAAG